VPVRSRSRGVERIRKILSDRLGSLDRQRALPVEELPQRFARNFVHHVVEQAVVPPRLVHRHDVGLANPGEHPRLGEEAPGDRGPLGQLGMGNLDRDAALQGPVHRFVDEAHSAPAELRFEPVVGVQRRLQDGEQVFRGAG
jgi:hypothetical protein